MKSEVETITSNSAPTRAVAEHETRLSRREPSGGLVDWIAQSPRMLQQKATLQALFAPAAQRQAPVPKPNHTGELHDRAAMPEQSVAQLQQIKLELPTNGHEEAGRNRLPIQREVIKIGTDSEEGTLTYAPAGTIKLSNGTPLKGIVLVLIYIPKAERSKKYGGKLMAHFMDKVVKNNVCYLDVKVSDEGGLNAEQLVAWYQKYGFQVVGTSSSGPVMGINMPKVQKESKKKSTPDSGPLRLVNYSDSDEEP